MAKSTNPIPAKPEPVKCPWCDHVTHVLAGHVVVDGKVTSCPRIDMAVTLADTQAPPDATIR